MCFSRLFHKKIDKTKSEQFVSVLDENKDLSEQQGLMFIVGNYNKREIYFESYKDGKISISKLSIEGIIDGNTIIFKHNASLSDSYRWKKHDYIDLEVAKLDFSSIKNNYHYHVEAVKPDEFAKFFERMGTKMFAVSNGKMTIDNDLKYQYKNIFNKKLKPQWEHHSCLPRCCR